MARADGNVTRDEVAAFHEVFEVPPGEEDHVRLVFDLARKSTHGFDSYARQVRRLFASDPVVLEHMLDGLFHIALADGRLCDAEDAYLREVARLFGFDAAAYARIRAHHVEPVEMAGENAHAILGVDPEASLSDIRIAYHRLVRETHPDLVVAKGLPPECVALANARIARINAAYDSVAKAAQSRHGLRMIGISVRERSSPNHAPRDDPPRIDMLVLHYTGMRNAGRHSIGYAIRRPGSAPIM